MADSAKRKIFSTIDFTTSSANRFGAWLVLIIGIVLGVELVAEIAYFGMDGFVPLELFLYVVTIALSFAAYAVCAYLMKTGHESPIRFLVVGSLLAITSLMILMYSSSAWLTLSVVIFVTTLYYNPRFTICTGVLVYFVNMLLAVGTLYVPPYIDFDATFPLDGTILALTGDDTLVAQIGFLSGDVSWIDYESSIPAAIINSALIGFFGYSFVTIICVIAAYLTHRAVERERELAAKQERTTAEFEAAAEMQKQMLTDVASVFKNQEEIDIHAIMDPAREVGGDFYIAQYVGSNRIGFLVADVSGKGMSAALFASNAQALSAWPSYSIDNSPAQILTDANKALCANNETMMFVTLWMGELDLETGMLRYSNAGHNPPLICKQRDGDLRFEYLRDISGPMLGVRPRTVYKDFHLQLEPGDTLLLYTDGVTESINPAHEEYGEERLQDYLNAHAGQMCGQIVGGLRADVKEFSAGTEQFDDITMLAVRLEKLRQKNDQVQIASKTRFFAATDDNLDEMKDFLRTELAKVDLDSVSTEVVTACVEELFVNINHYAYDKPGGAQCINIWSEASSRTEDASGKGGGTNGNASHPARTLHVELIDSGTPFNPLEDAAAPNLGPIEQRPIGGLGIYLVRQVMDEVTYAYESGCNIVHLSKEI